MAIMPRRLYPFYSEFLIVTMAYLPRELVNRIGIAHNFKYMDYVYYGKGAREIFSLHDKGGIDYMLSMRDVFSRQIGIPLAKEYADVAVEFACYLRWYTIDTKSEEFGILKSMLDWDHLYGCRDIYGIERGFDRKDMQMFLDSEYFKPGFLPQNTLWASFHRKPKQW